MTTLRATTVEQVRALDHFCEWAGAIALGVFILIGAAMLYGDTHR